MPATLEDLLDNLEAKGAIQSEQVREVMKEVDRVYFCPLHPYKDSPQSIGYNATISAPHMHAYALELLRDRLIPGSRALDVGSGSGYLTACFAVMVGEGGRAVGVEHIDQLVDKSIASVRKAGLGHLLDTERLKFVKGDGRKGYASSGPYDVVHVGAASPSVPPALSEQLAKGGRLVLPEGGEGIMQKYVMYDKGNDGKLRKKNLVEVRFVPLTDKEKQGKRKLCPCL